MSKIKTEHNGAKNGGGFWGTRSIAKKISKRLRRIAAKKEIARSQLNGNEQTTYAFCLWQLTYVRSLRRTGRKSTAESACTRHYSVLPSLSPASTSGLMRVLDTNPNARGMLLIM